MPLGTNQQTIVTGNVFRPTIWSKEALAARENALVLVPLVRHYDRDIQQGGKAIQIPNISNLNANAKVANTQVTLNAPTETATTINIDQHWESSVLIEDILDTQAAYDLASAYTEKTGYAIAAKMDSFVATGLSAATNTVGTYGTALTYAVFVSALQTLNVAAAPTTDRAIVLTPKGYSDALNIDQFIRYDAMGVGGGSNPIHNGQVGMILGMPVMMSQNLVVTAGTPVQNNSLMFQKEAYAIAVQRDQKFEHQRKTEYLGDLYVTSALWGGTILRPDHVVVLKS